MDQGSEREQEPLEPDEIEKQPEKPGEKEYEKNPDLEDPRLFSPLLGPCAPGTKDRSGEDVAEDKPEAKPEEQPENDPEKESEDNTEY